MIVDDVDQIMVEDWTYMFIQLCYLRLGGKDFQ